MIGTSAAVLRAAAFHFIELTLIYVSMGLYLHKPDQNYKIYLLKVLVILN